jgi:hypothetical protein
VTAWSARLLGERSPIIDIEHTYLYSPATISAMLEKVGFTAPQVRSVRNTYSVAYLGQLLPFPASIKGRVLSRLRRSSLGRATVTVPLGNLCAIAQKPS